MHKIIIFLVIFTLVCCAHIDSNAPSEESRNGPSKGSVIVPSGPGQNPQQCSRQVFESKNELHRIM